MCLSEGRLRGFDWWIGGLVRMKMDGHGYGYGYGCG